MGNRPESVAGSFRDPSGFLFILNDVLYRQVNDCYREAYDHLIGSGLYDALTSAGMLIPHEELSLELAPSSGAYKVIRPEQISFISYPYEQCFSQLKDSALLTLAIHKQALDYGMVLKDASAYNVQLHRGCPIFIDTLSFELYREGEPWIAYQQFCQHFLAPLALMAYTDVRLGQLLRIYIDGIPLDLASRLLPKSSHFVFSLLTHIHMHAKSQARYGGKGVTKGKTSGIRVSKMGMLGLIDSLRAAISKLRWKPDKTEWANYYEQTNYSDSGTHHKSGLVRQMVEHVAPQSVWDLGANLGIYSRIASATGAHVMSWDVDPAAVEKNYQQLRAEAPCSLVPLVLDLTNPSGGIGWGNEERSSFEARGPCDLVMALALVHHLAISNNVPLKRIAVFFARLSHHLLIEFVPKEDSQVKRLLATREDIFDHYHQQGFEEAFQSCFEILKAEPIINSTRLLYLMRRKL